MRSAHSVIRRLLPCAVIISFTAVAGMFRSVLNAASPSPPNHLACVPAVIGLVSFGVTHCWWSLGPLSHRACRWVRGSAWLSGVDAGDLEVRWVGCVPPPGAFYPYCSVERLKRSLLLVFISTYLYLSTSGASLFRSQVADRLGVIEFLSSFV